MKYFAKGLWVDRHLAQWMTTIMIILHVALGFSIVAGGEQRFDVPSYSPLVDYVHGNVWLWGVIVLMAALLMSVPFRWPNIIGLWVAMCWHIVWAACFAIASIRFDSASTTLAPVYGGLAMINAALLTARVIDKSRE